MSIAEKRILLTTSHGRIGSGGSMQLYLLARAARQAGAHVECVFAHSPGSFADRHLDRLADLGVPVHQMRPSRWYNPAEIARMRRLLRDGRFDLVHTHKGGDLSLVLLASAGLPRFALVNTRGVNFPLGANRFKYNLNRLDRAIVVSEDSKRVMARSGVRPDKIEVIYGGVDIARFVPRPELRAPVRAELGIAPDAFVFLMVANLVRQKGHGDYLEAAARLARSHPGAFHLFAGKGDSSAWQARAAELGLADVVRFLGFRSDVERLFAAADASVVSSFAGEGVSGVLRESMACAVPVITTNVGGNAELVADGETGLVVPMRDPPALAAAMARMIDGDALRTTLSQKGLVLVRERFSDDARAARIFALYVELLSGTGS
ncbi:MAG: glycosyltransferase [Deltaproteobacteria bacterium]|nr:glycosyltransferase [Deltaproteobacteria bacterium]